MDDSFSELFQTTVSVRQGGACSPALFSIYIEDLIYRIDAADPGINIGILKISILAYADDLLIMSTTKVGLQAQLRLIEDYGKLNGIKYNPSKTELIVFNELKHRALSEHRADWNQANVMLDGDEIEQKRSIRYLGSIISDDLSNFEHISRSKRAGQSALTRIKD